MYSSMFIDDLAANYYTQDEAIDLLRMPASTFWEWVKVEGIGFVKIGKVWLFPKDVIVAKRRAG
jgi:excisionase family DNA binding protein